MERREFLSGIIVSAVLPTASTAAAPQRLFHYEMPIGYYDLSNNTEMLKSFWRGISIAAKRRYSSRKEDIQAMRLVRQAARDNIPFEIFYTVEPSDYPKLSDFRKVTFFARAINPDHQTKLNAVFAETNVKDMSTISYGSHGVEIRHPRFVESV